jgi:glycosyltransferase involved in cell wall biosynthesis
VKFLFISPRYSGGIGGQATMLANHLQNSGHSVTKMKIPHIPIKNFKNPSFATLGLLKGLINREQYDIVHAFNVPSAFAMHYAKGKKKVLSVYGVFSDQIESLHSKTISSIARSTESKILKWADALTTDSKFTQKIYKEKFGFDFEFLPSAIDTTKLDEIQEVSKIQNQVIYLGRDSYEKGIDLIQRIESQINGKLIYCTNLTWEKAMVKLKESYLMAVPSRIESLPTNIKEAFYFRIPVIATNTGGIPELVTHNKTGILVPKNNPEKLLNEINNLLRNEKKAQILSDNAFDFVIKNLTWKIILPKYIQFYEKLLRS